MGIDYCFFDNSVDGGGSGGADSGVICAADFDRRFEPLSVRTLLYTMNFAGRARKVVCIGRNYADHAKELGNATPKQPFFFLKPPSSILLENQGPILRPRGVKLHYELELAVIMSKRLSNIRSTTFNKRDAQEAIEGYALALDLTARNVQDEAKSKGLPWSIAKGFDTFLPMSDMIPKFEIPDWDNAFLKLTVNGQTRQADSTGLMVFKIPQILATISNVMTLEPGDIVLTGTPKGVGEIVPGDRLHGELVVNEEVVVESEMDFHVAESNSGYEFKET